MVGEVTAGKGYIPCLCGFPGAYGCHIKEDLGLDEHLVWSSWAFKFILINGRIINEIRLFPSLLFLRACTPKGNVQCLDEKLAHFLGFQGLPPLQPSGPTLHQVVSTHKLMDEGSNPSTSFQYPILLMTIFSTANEAVVKGSKMQKKGKPDNSAEGQTRKQRD